LIGEKETLFAESTLILPSYYLYSLGGNIIGFKYQMMVIMTQNVLEMFK